MSNILIIKHGSLGDLIQAIGAIEDIKKSNIKEIKVETVKFTIKNFDICPFKNPSKFKKLS